MTGGNDTVAIVGAGVIGMATALRLLDDGREVVLIDPEEPGSGASFGNAGTVAAYGCVPVDARANGLRREGSGALLGLEHDGRSDPLRAGTVVIAAGAHSRALAQQAGEAVPLDTERGYHLEYRFDTPPVQRPVCPIERGFYMTPMTGRLRVAGTVELGGLARPADPKRWALLDRGARSLFPELPGASSQWLGFRPSVPDSVPVIGRARGVPAAILAFGHGHLGLTLAAVTADLVAADVAGRAGAAALAAYSPQRFSR